MKTLCSFSIFFFEKPDKPIVKELIFLIPSQNTIPSLCILENLKNFRPAESPLQSNQKLFVHIYQLVEVTELQNAAGETRYICYFGLLSMNDKLLADSTKILFFVEFTVPINNSSKLARFKPSQLFMMSSGGSK